MEISVHYNNQIEPRAQNFIAKKSSALDLDSNLTERTEINNIFKIDSLNLNLFNKD